jgi:hypothetical protein
LDCPTSRFSGALLFAHPSALTFHPIFVILPVVSSFFGSTIQIANAPRNGITRIIKAPIDVATLERLRFRKETRLKIATKKYPDTIDPSTRRFINLYTAVFSRTQSYLKYNAGALAGAAFYAPLKAFVSENTLCGFHDIKRVPVNCFIFLEKFHFLFRFPNNGLHNTVR